MKKRSIFLMLIFSSILAFGNDDYNLNQEKEKLNRLFLSPQTIERDSAIFMSVRIFHDNTKFMEESEFKSACVKKMEEFYNLSKWPEARAFYYFFTGLEYLRSENLFSAFEYLEKSISEFEGLGDMYHYAMVNYYFVPMMTWNMIENDIREEDKIKYANYINDAHLKAESDGDDNLLSNIMITEASYTMFVLNDFEKGLVLIEKIDKLLENKDREEWFYDYYITRLGEAVCYLNLGEIPRGEKILDHIIKDVELQPDPQKAGYLRGQIAGFVGKFYLRKNNLKKALWYAEFGENKVNFISFPYFENYYNKTLYLIFKANNMPEKALKYLEKVTEYEKKSKAERLNQGFMEWEMKYESEKQKTYIKTLENESLLRSEQHNKEIRNALLFILLLGVVGTGFIINSNKRLKNKNLELEQKNLEISGAMVKGQNLERSRVASELHDNLNTKIAALKWRLQADPEIANSGQFKNISDILGDIYQDIRLISHNLIPEDLETKGLVWAVQKLINHLSNHPIKFHFINSGYTKEMPLNSSYQMYNIILELVNNVLKHSGAKQAWISLSSENDKVHLSVSDNGKGINQEILGEGVGLRNVIARVESLKGSLDFKKPDTEGTMVLISIPVTSERESV